MLSEFKKLFNLAPLTAILILLSCLISVLTWFGQIPTTLSWFVFDSTLINEGQIWRVISPIFLHFPMMGVFFAHLAFNMIWLYQFGHLIERTHGTKFLAILVISSGIISNYTQAIFSLGIFGGMSGVVYALLGYLWLSGLLIRHYPARIQNNIAYFLIIFMLLAAFGILGDGIANAAHLAGFIVGLFFAVGRYFLKTSRLTIH